MSDKPDVPTFDLAGYHEVTIVKTDEVDGHAYRRGSSHTVDAATLQQLRDREMIDPDRIKPVAGR